MYPYTESLALPYGRVTGLSGTQYKTGDACRIIGGKKDGRVEVRMEAEPQETLLVPSHWVNQNPKNFP